MIVLNSELTLRQLRLDRINKCACSSGLGTTYSTAYFLSLWKNIVKMVLAFIFKSDLLLLPKFSFSFSPTKWLAQDYDKINAK